MQKMSRLIWFSLGGALCEKLSARLTNGNDRCRAPLFCWIVIYKLKYDNCFQFFKITITPFVCGTLW